MKNQIGIFLLILVSTFNVHSQIAVMHQGISVFSGENYMGVQKNIKAGQTINVGFVIKSIRLWPGYEADLSSSVYGSNDRKTEDLTTISANKNYDIATAVAGGNNFGPFYAQATGGGNGKMVAYLSIGTHDIESKLGGAIVSIKSDPSYEANITGSSSASVTPLSNPILYSKTNYKGQTQLLTGKTIGANSLNFTVKSVAIPPGSQFTVEISGVNAGSVYTKTFYTNVVNLNQELKTLASGFTRPPATYITIISR